MRHDRGCAIVEKDLQGEVVAQDLVRGRNAGSIIADFLSVHTDDDVELRNEVTLNVSIRIRKSKL